MTKKINPAPCPEHWQYFDPAEIKQRVAASRSKLSAVAQDERERNAHLLRVLEGVEKTLVQNQRHISGLEENHDRAVEEFRRLRGGRRVCSGAVSARSPMPLGPS
jgi:hypothetical protein